MGGLSFLYFIMVEKAKHYIQEGDIFQVVLSNPMRAKAEGSLFDTYRVLRATNPSPYMFYFSSDDIELAGASPETLVKLEGKKLTTFPLAGTRPRGKTKQEDIKMIKEAIVKLSKKEDLTYQEAETVMDEIMSGQATPVQMSSYLTALSMKGETIDEITASAAGMRAHCIKLLHDLNVLEIVGIGGDGANSFNISTTSSQVIAAGGVPVAKHGNRAASSKSGAALKKLEEFIHESNP